MPWIANGEFGPAHLARCHLPLPDADLARLGGEAKPLLVGAQALVGTLLVDGEGKLPADREGQVNLAVGKACGAP